MNPELVAVTDYQFFIICLLCLGSFVVGYIFGILTANYGFQKRVDELEELYDELKLGQ